MALTRVSMARRAVRDRPVKSLVRDVDRQNAPLAIILLAPAGAIHHPKKRRLDPRHPRHAERRRNESLMLQRAIGDLVRVRLINADRAFVVFGADFALRKSHRGNIALKSWLEYRRGFIILRSSPTSG